MLTALKNQEPRILNPKKRPGTKNFMDVPLELRKEDFNSVAGKYYMSILPKKVGECFKKAVLETGINSEDAFVWLEHALSFDDKGKKLSPIAQSVSMNPYNPFAFKYIYGEEDALSEMDKGYMLTSGAHAIYLRLQSLIDRLPELVLSERKKQGLKKNEKFHILNIGSAFSLDTLYMLYENHDLRDKIKVTCIDPDKSSLEKAEKCAIKLGINDSFEFITEKVENAKFEKGHMILFIGMFCPTATRICVLTLNHIKKHLQQNGVVIFSTVQEKMLMNGPILDFIMWSYGWRMYFKKNDEPGKMARLAGLDHEESLDWEDELGFNRMTVARLPKPSVIKRIGDAFSLVRTFMF